MTPAHTHTHTYTYMERERGGEGGRERRREREREPSEERELGYLWPQTLVAPYRNGGLLVVASTFCQVDGDVHNRQPLREGNGNGRDD